MSRKPQATGRHIRQEGSLLTHTAAVTPAAENMTNHYEAAVWSGDEVSRAGQYHHHHHHQHQQQLPQWRSVLCGATVRDTHVMMLSLTLFKRQMWANVCTSQPHLALHLHWLPLPPDIASIILVRRRQHSEVGVHCNAAYLGLGKWQ
jgi:hypothetical protein